MQIAIPLYDRFTALDAVGPYEVLCRLPGARVEFVAVEPGVIRTDTRMLTVMIDQSLDAVPSPDVVVVPGGIGSRTAMHDDRLLDWLRGAHSTTRYTTSVCTGALILGAAGVLDGLKATTHWCAMDRLESPVSERVVEQGKVITAAGVSAGIDMALMLAAKIAGDDVVQAIQLGIEYDPQPPFDSGSPDKAPAHVKELVRAAEAAEEAEVAAS
jgi:putative intracellular protease/amidase